jgi:F0F1-type ATP synthase membrane subunit c/vacuolar-type H+-ATPase subunit K
MRTTNPFRRMLLLTATIALLMGLATFAEATEAGTLAAALTQAQAENKPVVIDFYTDW